LPDAIQLGVQNATLSTWSAQRIFKPLARANKDHAHRLLESIEKNPMSTRELSTWFEEYKKANHGQREKLIEQPALLLKALAQDNRSEDLADGIDGQWLSSSKKTVILLKKLLRLLPQVLNTQTQTDSQLALLLNEVKPIKSLTEQLQQKLDEVNHVRRAHQNQHQVPEPIGDLDSTNQSNAKSLTQCSAQLSQAGKGSSSQAEQTPRGYLEAARALLSDEG